MKKKLNPPKEILFIASLLVAGSFFGLYFVGKKYLNTAEYMIAGASIISVIAQLASLANLFLKRNNRKILVELAYMNSNFNFLISGLCFLLISRQQAKPLLMYSTSVSGIMTLISLAIHHLIFKINKNATTQKSKI